MIKTVKAQVRKSLYIETKYQEGRLRLTLFCAWLACWLPSMLVLLLTGQFVGFLLAVVGGVILAWLLAPKDWDVALGFEHHCGRRWSTACLAVRLFRRGTDGKLYTPKLSSLYGHPNNWTATVFTSPSAGWDIELFRDKAEALREAMGVNFLSFYYDLAGDGSSRVKMRVSVMAIPVAVVEVPKPAVRLSSVQIIERVPIAIRSDGGIFTISVGMHTLLAGVSGSGKSGYMWSIVMGLAQPIATGHVRLWGLDPKQLEFSIAPDWWHRYGGTESEMVELLEEADKDMYERAQQLKGKARKVSVSPSMPLNVVLIDELADLQKIANKELQKRADRALQSILRKGRALGYVVIGAIQDPRKETLPDRDLYPNTIGLRLPTSMIDLVLGQGAKEAGARCDQIPKDEKLGAGMAYAVVPGESMPVLMRSPLIDDDKIRLAWQAVLSYRESITVESLEAGAALVLPDVDLGLFKLPEPVTGGRKKLSEQLEEIRVSQGWSR